MKMKMRFGAALAALLFAGNVSATKMDTLELVNGITHATLTGTAPSNGTVRFCTDCALVDPCASGGTGAVARRENGAWNCGVETSPTGQVPVGITRAITAGAGLAGGGSMAADRAIDVTNSDGTITVGADTVSRAAITGDIGVPAGSNTATLPSIVAAGTNLKLTYNIKGQVTAGTTASCADLSDDGTACTANSSSFDAAGAAAAAQAASQPLDATLTALAAANWATNSLAIGTGSDTVGQVTFAANTFPARASTGSLAAKTITDFGLSLVDDADATAARTTLGLGTAATQNVGAFDAAGAAAAAQAASQPLDATLTALAAANWAANAVPIGSGADALSQVSFAANTFPARASTGNLVAKTITDFGLSFADDADATAGRSTLGLGTLATQSGTFSGTSSGTNTGDITLTASGSSANANAATLVGQQLQLQQASTSFAGLMSGADKIKLNGKWKDAVSECLLDNTGAANNTDAEWQACYDSFPATGGVLFLPAGTYDLPLTAASVTITRPVITVGAGRSISAISISHATRTAFISGTGSAGMGFEQMRFTAPLSTTRTAGFAWDMAAIANTYFQQADCLYQWSCIHSGGALQFVDDANLREGGANAASGQFILIDSTGDRYIRRLTTDNPSDPTTFAGVRVRECSSLVITDSNIINSTNALDIVPNAGGGHAVASVLVVNTFFDSSVIGVNILPASASDTAHRIRIVNSWFGSNTTANVRMGNGTIPNANIASVDFLGDDFFSNATSPFGLDVQGATDWSVRGSRFGGHTTNAVRVAVGTGTADQRFSITDNLIGSSLGVGANAQGVTIGAGTYGQYQILDNRGLASNTTGGISDSGVVTGFDQKQVQGNLGHKLNGKLAATVAASAAFNTTETVVVGGLNIAPLPANSSSSTDVFKVKIWGTVTATVANAITARIRIGTAGTIADGFVLQAPMGNSAAAGTNIPFELEMMMTVRTIGAAATVHGTASMRNASVTSNATASTGFSIFEGQVIVPTFQTFNSTVANYIEATMQTGAATTTVTVQGATIEVM